MALLVLVIEDCANESRSPPSLLTLLEIRKHHPEVFQHLEVYIDCGVRRGTDIVKALCLGAKAVGMGRPFLYSLTYGQEGVEHFIDSKLFLRTFRYGLLTYRSHAR
jgi:isopentenyl diphosphate isomerase/L-lactate dehydrogenase-like FMN-dependent dehydrogenase